jgi:hypothetical protein
MAALLISQLSAISEEDGKEFSEQKIIIGILTQIS